MSASSTFPLFLVRLVLLLLLTPPFSGSSASRVPSCSPLSADSVSIQHLLVATHPDLVVDTHRPHFTWQVSASSTDNPQRSVVQAAYQLQLGTITALLRPSVPTLVWDSGRVTSNVSRHVPYTGPPLSSDTPYHWSLTYWLPNGFCQHSSGTLRTSLFHPSADFQGQWIGHDRLQMNELRKEFPVPASLRRATVFLAAAGYYELYVNGQRIDPTRRLDPGVTEYERDVLYVSFDVTLALQPSSGATGAVGVRLGDGWYSQQQNPPGFGSLHSTYGPSRLLFQLNLQSADGMTSIVSDPSWMGREGTVTASSPFMGERYSALKERLGWAEPNFTDPYSLWLPAVELPSPIVNATAGMGLRLQTFDPVRAGDAALHVAVSGQRSFHIPGPLLGADLAASRGVFHPVSSTGVSLGVTMYDLGQTFAGTCEVQLRGLPPRVLVTFRHAEILQQPGANGMQFPILDSSNLRGAVSTDDYVTKGTANETYMPAFTYHGFRYFAIHGIYDGDQVQDVTCYAIHSETTLVGDFQSSSPVINQILHNVSQSSQRTHHSRSPFTCPLSPLLSPLCVQMQWSHLNNAMSMPTDCSQRDERRGWMGDAAAAVEAGLFNFDLYGFYASWVQQIALEQSSDGAINDVVPVDGQHIGRQAPPAVALASTP